MSAPLPPPAPQSGHPGAQELVTTGAGTQAHVVTRHDALPGLPSPWVSRWAPLIRPGGSVLDLACGSGRHVRYLAAKGFAVTGVDRDAEATAGLAVFAEIINADVENGPWPLTGRQFDAIVVTNYLWRPLLPLIGATLAPGGCLIYETFALGHEAHGRPRRAEFLLRPGELLQAFAGFRVLAFEDGFEAAGPRCVQRLAALGLAPDAVAGPALELDHPAAR